MLPSPPKPYSNGEKWTVWVVIALLLGVIVGIVLRSNHLVIKPQHLAIEKVYPVTDGFKPEKGEFAGKQKYDVSVQKDTKLNGHVVQGGDCKYILVIDLYMPERNLGTLIKELQKIPGVNDNGVEIGTYKIAIRKPCTSGNDPNLLWTWNDVWKGVKTALDRYYRAKE